MGWGIKKQTSGLLDIYNTPFTAQPGFRVYWTFQPPHTAMSNWEYEQTSQSWHLDVEPEDPNWAPRYVQDVAYFLSKAKETFQNKGLTVPDGTVNVFVRNIGADGQYGSVSGAIYINNKVQGQAPLTHPQELRAVCAHEFMHLVQDYEYVMNKGTIGLWWLEALATQADGMVWQDSPFTESELWITDNNNAFLQTLCRSWDDCGVDPNYYLAGCFLQYLSKYRGGGAINIADLVTAGGAYGSTFSSYVEVLDSEIQKQLDSNIGMEFSSYVEYLFMAGNPKLKAIPDGNGFLSMETAQSFVKTTRIIDGSLKVERSPSISTIGTEQTVSASLPYLSAQLINVVNHDLRYRRVEYTLSKSDFSFGLMLARVSPPGGKLQEIKKLYNGDSGSLILNARSGAVKDRCVMLLVNPYMTGENKTVELGLRVTDDVSVNIEEGDMDKELLSSDTSFTQTFTAVTYFEGDYLFKWDFGDGSSAEQSITEGTQSQVTHTYENVEPGDSIDVQVTVYTPDGTILLGNDTVTITTLPLYRVVYDGNGNDEGTVPVDTQGYLEGEAVTILGNSGNLSGPYKTFAGWNTESNGSGTSYAAGAQFEMGDDDVTLYAQYYTDSECFEVDENGTITEFSYYPEHGKDVVIPPNLNIKRIGDGAFYGKGLRSIIIPEGVVSIGKSAFRGNALVYVKIPDSCTSIGDYGLDGLNYWDEVAPLTIVIGSNVVFGGFDEGGFKTVYYSYGRAKGTYTFVQKWEWSEAYQEYLPAGGKWAYRP